MILFKLCLKQVHRMMYFYNFCFSYLHIIWCVLAVCSGHLTSNEKYSHLLKRAVSHLMGIYPNSISTIHVDSDSGPKFWLNDLCLMVHLPTHWFNRLRRMAYLLKVWFAFLWNERCWDICLLLFGVRSWSFQEAHRKFLPHSHMATPLHSHGAR